MAHSPRSHLTTPLLVWWALVTFACLVWCAHVEAHNASAEEASPAHCLEKFDQGKCEQDITDEEVDAFIQENAHLANKQCEDAAPHVSDVLKHMDDKDEECHSVNLEDADVEEEEEDLPACVAESDPNSVTGESFAELDLKVGESATSTLSRRGKCKYGKKNPASGPGGQPPIIGKDGRQKLLTQKCIAKRVQSMRDQENKMWDSLSCKMKRQLYKRLASEMEKKIRSKMVCKLKGMSACSIPPVKKELLKDKLADDMAQKASNNGANGGGGCLPSPTDPANNGGMLGIAKDHCNINFYDKRNYEWSTIMTESHFGQVNDVAVALETCDMSLLIMTANAHVKPVEGNANEGSWLYSSFMVDGIQPEPGGADWGQYHIYKAVAVDWAPMNFVQQYIVKEGLHTVSLQVRVMGGAWKIDGLAIQVAVIPFAGKNDWGNGDHARDLLRLDNDNRQKVY
eukprot:GFYU01003086.1.p1 GENE.GFYU01003086.1~~GFYU01003086.1.p1  ORF type:complete len:455 (-),score=153.91 GFYU01003086.1:156-1520(-)